MYRQKHFLSETNVSMIPMQTTKISPNQRSQADNIRVVQMMRLPRTTDFSIEKLFGDTRAHMPVCIDVEVFTCRNHSNGFMARLMDTLSARRCQADVNHVTGDVHYLTFLLDKKRTILTIHDLAHLSRLKGLKRWLYLMVWFWIPIRRCAAVTVISEETKQQLLRAVRCDRNKLHVIHNAVSNDFRASPYIFNSTKPRLLQIGTNWNKNLERVIQALSGINCQFIVLGPLSANQIKLLLRHRIDYKNYFGLTRDAVIAEFSACDALLFTSTHEGFGLPILEANATGRPVITSKISSMPEVAGESACLVDPYDVEDIRRGVRRVLEDTAYRNGLIEKGFENVSRFRPEVTARAYAELYKSVYDNVRAGTASNVLR